MWIKLLTCNVPTTQTGRLYPKEVVEEAMNEYRSNIDDGIAFGELGTGDSVRAESNLSKISHRVTDMRFDGDDLYAEIEIMSTPYGDMLKELLAVEAVRLSPVGIGVADNLTIETYELLKTQFIPNDE